MSLVRLSFFIPVWCLLILTPTLSAHSFTIMLDPAGHAKHTGRTIENTFERAVTLSIAQALEKALHSKLTCTVIITRSPGEIVSPLQNANFSNRLPVDLFINLNCYQATHGKLSLYLYYFSDGKLFTSTPPKRSLIPFDKAHLLSVDRTKIYTQQIAQTLHSSSTHTIKTYGPFSLPCTALMGIIAPAISIEFCIAHKDDWIAAIEPLSAAIAKALTS